MDTFLFGFCLILIPYPPEVSLDDCLNFPPYSVTMQYIDGIILPHRAWVEARFNQRSINNLDECDYWKARSMDMYHRWDCWDDLRIATKPADYWSGALSTLRYYPDRWWAWKWFFTAPFRDCDTRLQALRRIRNRVGWYNYYHGYMPAPVPVWLFDRDDDW